VNNLQENLRFKDREIEKLHCKLHTLKEEAKEPEDEQLFEEGEY